MKKFRHFFGIVIISIIMVAVCRGQEKGSREYHIQDRTLYQYYHQQVPDEVYEIPWKIKQVSYKNKETDRIDNLYAPSEESWLNTAWGVMEMKTGIVPEDKIAPMAEALLKFWENPEIQHKYKDYYGLQNYISELYGDQVAGFLMVARTLPTMRQQFAVRHELTKLLTMLYDFSQVLLETADLTKEAVMPGYTHFRHAQPTTLGHYLMSVYDAVWRSLSTVEEGYKMMSLNELGCGALAGTSWPIDREMVSRYLGCEGLIENTNDAVSYTDGYVQLVAGLSNVMAILSRLGVDLYNWSTLEYNFLDFEIGGGSFMMPNKRSNQGYFENTYIASARMVGYLTEVAAMGIRIPHGDMNAMAYNMKYATLNAIEDLGDWIVKPLLYHLPGMKVYENNMMEIARKGYSCSTELANEIVRRFGIDYLTAHTVVNVFVKKSEQEGIPSKDAEIKIFDLATNEVIGRKLDLSESNLRKILDPVWFVEVTNSRGGISPSEVSRMITDRWRQLDLARQRHLDRIDEADSAKQQMLNDLRELYDNHKNRNKK
jgi:argininosuccinate lyase